MAEPAVAPGGAAGPLRPLVQLVSSNVLGAFVGGVFFLTASWTLPIDEMGRYAVAISAQWIAVGLIGSGLSVAALRLGADRLAADDRAGAAGVVLQAAATALATSLVVGLGAALLGAALPERLGWLPLLVAGWAGARAVIDCIRSGFLAAHDFGRAALLMVGTAVTGLAALSLAASGGALTLERLLAAHVGGLAAGMLLAFGLAVSSLRGGVRFSRAQLAALLRYARWPALAEGTRLLQVNAGPLLLISLVGAEQAGLFGVARYPAYVFDVIALSLYQYWLSTAVRSPSGEGMRRFLGMQLRLAAGVGALVLLAALAASPLLGLLGEPFDAVAPLFVLNALDFAILMLVRPAESAYHGLHQPWLEWAQRLTVLPLLLVSGWLLAPAYGAAGMVWAHVASGVFALGVAALLLRGRIGGPRPIVGAVGH